MKVAIRSQQGQILLITLLVLTVATTIALSLISRATIDLSMSNQLEESTRAFNAAEAGIEQALKSGTGGVSTLTPGITYDVSIQDIAGASGVFSLSHKTPQNVTETVWLAEHDDTTGELIETRYYQDSTIGICWSPEEGTDPAAALALSILYKSGSDGSYNVAHAALDPNAAARSNNFTSAGIVTTGCGLSYYGATLNFITLGITPTSDILLALRIRPVYAQTTLAIDGGTTGLPKQGNQIVSTGKTGTGVSRKVVVFQQYRAPLSIFDSVIYSQSSL